MMMTVLRPEYARPSRHFVYQRNWLWQCPIRPVSTDKSQLPRTDTNHKSASEIRNNIISISSIKLKSQLHLISSLILLSRIFSLNNNEDEYDAMAMAMPMTRWAMKWKELNGTNWWQTNSKFLRSILRQESFLKREIIKSLQYILPHPVFINFWRD